MSWVYVGTTCAHAPVSSKAKARLVRLPSSSVPFTSRRVGLIVSVVGAFTRAFTARELNTILAGFGYLYDETHDMEVRVVSSYKNNNERYFSNVADVKMTAYKGPATSIDATTMNIIGEAALGWDTDVPLNFIGNKKFTGVVELNYGQKFKLRREAGS